MELTTGSKTEGEGTMAEAAAGGERAEIERRLVGRSLEDEDFRRVLLADPKAALEIELGTPLPEAVRIVAVAGAGETWVGITCGTCYPGEGKC